MPEMQTGTTPQCAGFAKDLTCTLEERDSDLRYFWRPNSLRSVGLFMPNLLRSPTRHINAIMSRSFAWNLPSPAHCFSLPTPN